MTIFLGAISGNSAPTESPYEEARRLFEEALQALGRNIAQTRDALGPVLLPAGPFDGEVLENKPREDSELITWIRLMASTLRRENESLIELNARIQL